MPLDRGVCVTYIGRRMIVLRAMLFVVLTLIASVPPAQAEWRVPLDFSNWSKPQAACQPSLRALSPFDYLFRVINCKPD